MLIILANQLRRRAAHQAIDRAPDGYQCEIKEPTRSSDQNAALHAMLGDISKQKEWAGKKRDIEAWKVLMVSAHRMALKEEGEIIPGLSGEFVQLRRSTAKMGVKELGSLIEYVSAWCAQNDVKLTAPERNYHG